MKTKSASRQQMEEILAKKYKGKNCKFEYPGRTTVYAMVDMISIEELGEPLVIIQMDNKRFECSPEYLSECLTLL